MADELRSLSEILKDYKKFNTTSTAMNLFGQSLITTADMFQKDDAVNKIQFKESKKPARRIIKLKTPDVLTPYTKELNKAFKTGVETTARTNNPQLIPYQLGKFTEGLYKGAQLQSDTATQIRNIESSEQLKADLSYDQTKAGLENADRTREFQTQLAQVKTGSEYEGRIRQGLASLPNILQKGMINPIEAELGMRQMQFDEALKSAEIDYLQNTSQLNATNAKLDEITGYFAEQRITDPFKMDGITPVDKKEDPLFSQRVGTGKISDRTGFAKYVGQQNPELATYLRDILKDPEYMEGKGTVTDRLRGLITPENIKLLEQYLDEYKKNPLNV